MFWRQLKTSNGKIMVNNWKFNFYAIYIFDQRIFLYNKVFFIIFYLHFKVLFILENQKIKNLKP